MLAAAAPPWWVVIILPTLGIVFSAAIAFAAYYPHLKDRKAKQEAEEKHRKRAEATHDAVLGREADPYVGRARIPGLVETVPELRLAVDKVQRTVGHVNGSGDSVMDLIAKGNAETKVVKDALEIHINQDTHRFDEANRAIGANTQAISQLTDAVRQSGSDRGDHREQP